jgi:enterochelin esterase family protein
MLVAGSIDMNKQYYLLGALFALSFIWAWGLPLRPLPTRSALAAESQGSTIQELNKSDAGGINILGSDSPRLTRLVHDLHSGDRQALGAFWRDMEGKAPLVETSMADERRRLVTFLWRGDDTTTRVTLMGGLPGGNFVKPLKRLGDSDLWYLTESHPIEARFGYVFQVNGPEALPLEWRALMREIQQNSPRRDRLNTREYAGWSYVELPGAPPQPWIRKRADVAAGRQSTETFKSRILDAEYRLRIYTPPGYENDGDRCWLMIAFDGGFAMMDATLDNLLAAGKIPHLVVVGVENIDGPSRQRDLNCSDRFARFLADELVPWVRKTHRVYGDPAHTIVGGASLGGKMAAYCGLRHSGVFGNVLSQSGSFLTAAGQESPTVVWDGEAPGMLVRQFIQSPALPLKFYMEVGRYETALSSSLLLETRRLRDVLQAKGYGVAYSEFVGGHNEVCWRGSFANAIMALTAERTREE